MEWYQIATRILVPALIFGGMPFVMFLMLKSREKEELKTTKNEVVVLIHPKIYAYIGIILTAILTIFLIFAIIQDGTLFPCILFGTFVVIGLSLILLPITQRIVINEKEKHIISRNFFGFKKTILFSELLSYKRIKQISAIVIYTTKGKIFADEGMINYEKLEHLIRGRRLPNKKTISHKQNK